MALTDSQLRAVESTGRPLFIQAGAGTGKTFTLTKRLAHGLVSGAIPGVDRLLTVTFTEKAAAELTGRVRAELRSQGLVEEALGVDAAWISTIHSMCRRMLVSHAFEAGVDPGADMLEEMESDQVLARALDQVLARHAGSEELALLSESLARPDKVSEAIMDTAKLFTSVESGAASFDLGPAPRRSGADVLCEAHEAWKTAQEELAAVGFAKANGTAAGYCAEVDKRVELLGDALASRGEGDMSWVEVLDVFEEAGSFKHGKSKKQLGWETLDECCARVDDLAAETLAALCHEQAKALVALAGETYELHRSLKRAMGSMDVGDILVETHRLLAEHPEIASEYQARFVSVMIDEFQDTDRLQVSIAKSICDEGLTTLATVGDAQQSIYGFRGADLEVYREMREEMGRKGADVVSLDVNFRSHSGILAFVEDVFSTPDFFGDEFMRVGPGPANDRELPWASAAEPRVLMHLTAGDPDGDGKCPLADEMREEEAAWIASTFAELNGRGASYGGMALLLRKMTYVDVYIEAMRSHGVPCIVSGGSLFFTSDEVGALVMLLRFLENPDDDEACFTLLGSSMFDVGDDDLLALASLRNDGMRLPAGSFRKRPTLYDALCRMAGEAPEGEDGLLVRAHEVLSGALERSAGTPFATVLLRAVEESGWHDTLRGRGAEGSGVMANIWRFCDMVREYEERCGHSIVKTAEHFRQSVELAEEGKLKGGKPATMLSQGFEAVQIMTFHAAKGLEFPIVAVADYESTAKREARPASLSEAGKTYLAFLPPKSWPGGETVVGGPCACASFAKTSDAQSFLSYASHLSDERAEEEAQRLLYVAFTRAKDCLIVAGRDERFGEDGALKDGRQFTSVFHAAFPEKEPKDGEVLRTPKGALVATSVGRVVRSEEEKAVSGEAVLRAHCLAEATRADEVRSWTRGERRGGLRSYSSIARRKEKPAGALVPEMLTLSEGGEDGNDATAFGSAFHLVAQWLVGTPHPEKGALDARIAAAARTWGLDSAGEERLSKAVVSWLASRLYVVTLSFPRRFAEHAFCVKVGDMPLEGRFDLLCLDPSARTALVVDYKTGESGTEEELRERYRLQASCYAYAALSSAACDDVELSFVRPEVGMEQIRYRFSSGDLDGLKARILEEGAL